MSASMEVMPPGGHETYATSIFSKIKMYLDSNPYGYVSKAGDTMTGNLTAPKFIGALQGNASTASKLGSSNVGSANQPIYLNGGTATACTYTLGKSVPSNAVFTDHYAWTDITGKPSTFTPSTHYHYELKTIGDQRTISTTPNTYVDKLIFQGLKAQSYIGNPGGTSGYSYLLGLRGWGDSSGGDAHELAFNNNGIYCRHGSTTTWGNWSKIFTSADTYTGTLTSSQVTTALGYIPGPSYSFKSSDNSISFMGSAVGSVVTVSMTVNGKVSTEGDTISGDYVNTADFSESGVYGKRVTTYGPWGIDVEEYLANSLWSRLSLRDSDILLTKTWDGTNTSLKSAISAINQSLSNYLNYPADTTEVVVGSRNGKPLYRKYWRIPAVKVGVNTEQTLTSAMLPSTAINVTFSDKSYIKSGESTFNANTMFFCVYTIGTTVYFRQAFSSSLSWEIVLWAEYNKSSD